MNIANLRGRIQCALAETQRFIAKEDPRDPALRPAEIQKTLDFYKQHAVKLKTYLNMSDADLQASFESLA